MLLLSRGILWGRLDPEAKASAQPSGLWVQWVLETVRGEETHEGGVLETFASFHPADVLHFLFWQAGLRSAMQVFLHRELMPTPCCPWRVPSAAQDEHLVHVLEQTREQITPN